MIREAFLDEKEILEAVRYLPSISIILPFEPKMSAKYELDYQLKRITEKVEKDLFSNHGLEEARLVTSKLKKLISQLDYSTYKRSIAIYVSPVWEKIYYLDIPVEEKIIIDESFEIRDLVYSKKELHKYLVLVISSERSRIFLGNTIQFIRLSSNTPEHVAAYRNDIPERTSNFSDASHRKEVLLDKFLHHVDVGLGMILNAYPLPLFIMGTERTVGHFKKLSHYSDHIIGYVHGNFDEATQVEIREAVSPLVADWKKVKQVNLLHQLESARSAKKLARGVREVWKEAMQKKGRLLVVEKNYSYACRKTEGGQAIFDKDDIIGTPHYIKDAVDDIIEKVLQNGGDVEFVDEGLLNDYQHIALIQYY
jgi:hypothetical protein